MVECHQPTTSPAHHLTNHLTNPPTHLSSNAGVYQPSLPYAKWSVDGHEQTMQINYLSHFLMVR